jgi:hypothetical protein
MAVDAYACVCEVVPSVSILPFLTSALSLNRGSSLPSSDDSRDACSNHLVPCTLGDSNCHSNVGLLGNYKRE